LFKGHRGQSSLRPSASLLCFAFAKNHKNANTENTNSLHAQTVRDQITASCRTS